jgi:hypothetical protein
MLPDEIKINGETVLCLIKHHATKTYLGTNTHTFLALGLLVRKWSASRSGLFTPRKRYLGTKWIGCWLGHGTGLDAAEKRKTRVIAGNRITVVQPVA